MSIVGDMIDFGEDIVDAGKDLAEDAVDAAIDAAEQLAEVGLSLGDIAAGATLDLVEQLARLGDEALEKLGQLLDEATKAALAASKALQAAAEGIRNLVDDVASFVEDVVKRMQTFVGDVASAVSYTTALAADWIERNLPGPLSWIVDELLPFGWALIKLGAAATALLPTLAWQGAHAFICNLMARHYGHEAGTVAQAILRGDERVSEMHRIVRLPADGAYFITSDHHRWASADHLDMPTLNRTRLLYDAVLEYYGHASQWVLIENGDAEDYWLRGGSAYGVVYDLANHLPGPDLDRVFEGRLKLDSARAHLWKIRESYANTYARIIRWYDERHAYVRTNGNHDDVNLWPEMIEELRRHMRNIRVAEYVVLADGPRAVALIAHGHQTDALNYEACSYLGRTLTSLNSALRDLSLGEIKEGVPKQEVVQALLDGRAANELDQVGPFGANWELGSLDEQALFESFHRIWGTGKDIGYAPGPGQPVGREPWLLLGHTHVPLSSPTSRVTGGIWWRYLNSGCCILPDMITGVEWSRHDPASDPYPRLVAWTWNEPLRSLRRHVLFRTQEGTLAPMAAPTDFTLTVPLEA